MIDGWILFAACMAIFVKAILIDVVWDYFKRKKERKQWREIQHTISLLQDFRLGSIIFHWPLHLREEINAAERSIFNNPDDVHLRKQTIRYFGRIFDQQRREELAHWKVNWKVNWLKEGF